jgi:hypothetical protein
LDDSGDFTVMENYSAYTPRGEHTVSEATDRICAAILHSRQNAIARLCVDIRNMVNLPIPTLTERFQIGTRFAAAAGNAVRMVMICDPMYIDRDYFGILVAQNRGMEVNVFTNNEDAVLWLLSFLNTKNVPAPD